MSVWATGEYTGVAVCRNYSAMKKKEKNHRFVFSASCCHIDYSNGVKIKAGHFFSYWINVCSYRSPYIQNHICEISYCMSQPGISSKVCLLKPSYSTHKNLWNKQAKGYRLFSFSCLNVSVRKSLKTVHTWWHTQMKLFFSSSSDKYMFLVNVKNKILNAHICMWIARSILFLCVTPFTSQQSAYYSLLKWIALNHNCSILKMKLRPLTML